MHGFKELNKRSMSTGRTSASRMYENVKMISAKHPPSLAAQIKNVLWPGHLDVLIHATGCGSAGGPLSPLVLLELMRRHRKHVNDGHGDDP